MTKTLQIYGLLSENGARLHAISYDKEKLQSYISNNIDYIICKMNLYSISKTYNDKLLFSRVSSYKNNEKIYRIIINKKLELFNEYNILVKKSYFDNFGLLQINHDANENSYEYKNYLYELKNTAIFINNNITTETIIFDKYYDKPIICI
jgi:hypothetical protein